jgi:hypothetical protein
VKPGFSQTAAQKADAARVVHLIRITGGEEQRRPRQSIDSAQSVTCRD